MLATPDRSHLRSIVCHIYELAVCVCDTLCIFLQSISSSFSQFDHLFIGYDSRLPSTLGFSLLGKLPNVSPGISWWALLARLRRQRLWSVKSTCIINHTPELDNLRLGHLWISGVGSWSVVPTDSVLVVSASHGFYPTFVIAALPKKKKDGIRAGISTSARSSSLISAWWNFFALNVPELPIPICKLRLFCVSRLVIFYMLWLSASNYASHCSIRYQLHSCIHSFSRCKCSY